jgi:hypothetical protein
MSTSTARRAVVLAITLAVLAAGGWVFRHWFAAAAPDGAAPQDSPSASPGVSATLTRSPGKAMAAAFDESRLPAALPVGEDDPDLLAETLAAAVSAGDASSTAALVAAIEAAGYDIREDDGQTLRAAPAARQGLALDAWEVAACAKLYGSGYGVGLDRLAESLARAMPALHDAPLGDVLLQGIRDSAKSANPALRFWAKFITELGRRAPAPYDLLSDATSPAVRLDPVQTLFVVSRLAGDLAWFGRPAKSGGLRGRVAPDGLGTERRLGNARGGPSWLIADVFAAEEPPAPCSLTEIQGLVTDYAAVGGSVAFGQLASYLEKLGGPALAEYAERAASANVVLTVLKFLASYAALDVSIRIDGQPLVRTRTTVPGDRRTLTATVRVNTGKWQGFNCVRQVFNTAGLDFSLPADGPVSNVKVTWTISEGGGPSGLAAVLQTAGQLQEILTGKAPADPTAMVYLEDTHRNAAMDGISYTNTAGETSTFVVGMPREEDLSQRKVMKLSTRAAVAVDVQMKPTRLESKTAVGATIGDMAAAVIAGLSGDLPGLLATTTAESLYRAQWYQSDPFAFEVVDWTPCTLAWVGTITITRTLDKHEDKTESVTDAAGNVLGSEHTTSVTRANETSTFTLSPNRTESGSLVRMTYAMSEASFVKAVGPPLTGACGNGLSQVLGTRRDVAIRARSAQGAGETVGFAEVDLPENATMASLRIVTRDSDARVPISIKELRSDPWQITGCPGGPSSGNQWGGPSETHAMAESGFGANLVPDSVPVDPKHPDELRGTTQATDSDGSVRTIVWNLRRCGGE